MSENPHIPKFISKAPWYQQGPGNDNEGSLDHQRKDPTAPQIDHSLPQTGTGIKDLINVKEGVRVKTFQDWDAKRDRWHGHSSEEWENMVKNWASVKKKSTSGYKQDEDDSDDTDYELELVELGLNAKDIKLNLKEDSLEKTIRDRLDIPAYIRNISSQSHESNTKSTAEKEDLIVGDDQFVRKLTGDAKKLDDIQKFAWEKNQEYEQIKQREILQKNLAGSTDRDDNVIAPDLSLNLEASPTLMALKARQEQQQQSELRKVKAKQLYEKYGIQQPDS